MTMLGVALLYETISSSRLVNRHVGLSTAADPGGDATHARRRSAALMDQSVASGPTTNGPTTAIGSRLVRVRGQIVVSEYQPTTPGETYRPVDPLDLGTTDAMILSSATVYGPGDAATVKSDSAGRFLLEAEVPIGTRQLPLHITSNMLMPTRPGGHPVIALDTGSGSIDVDVEVPMVRALVAQPTFKGRPIKPKDLANPEVREAFIAQLNEINNAVLPPPSFPPPANEPGGYQTASGTPPVDPGERERNGAYGQPASAP
jgi:hypothetical protein